MDEQHHETQSNATSSSEVEPAAGSEADPGPGMVFTIEPGLYFREDDLKVPERLRGIGVRIEDDIVVTADGAERISEGIPRTIAGVEEWMAAIAGR